jgi:alkylhydroperoxidase family enzyme
VNTAGSFPLRNSLASSIDSGFDDLCAAFARQAYLPDEVLTACRHRLAQLHRVSAYLDNPEADSHVELPLAGVSQCAHSSESEQACIAFTEVYVMDPQAITDEHAQAVKAFFGDAGLVTLVEALGVFDGLIRLQLLWQEGGS